MGYAEESGIPYGFGFVKNRYIGRSFIYPTQEQRDAARPAEAKPALGQCKGQADYPD